jgi:hypothetical protein
MSKWNLLTSISVQVLKPLIVEETYFELVSVNFNGRADLYAALSTTTSTYIYIYFSQLYRAS